MTGISSMLKSLFESLSSIFSCVETNKEYQAETEIIRDKKKLKKASDISEEILMLIMKYKKCMDPKDQRELLRLVKRFRKNN